MKEVEAKFKVEDRQALLAKLEELPFRCDSEVEPRSYFEIMHEHFADAEKMVADVEDDN